MDLYELYNTDTKQVEENRWMDWSEAKKRNKKLQRLGEPYRWVPYTVDEQVVSRKR